VLSDPISLSSTKKRTRTVPALPVTLALSVIVPDTVADGAGLVMATVMEGALRAANAGATNALNNPIKIKVLTIL
jgi:hypothetical protein